METPPTVYPAIATVTAALIAGAIAFLSAVLSKEQKTSEFRQAWIDAIRSDISEFIGFVENFWGFVIYHQQERGIDAVKAHLEESHAELAKAASVYYRIRLRLNPNEHQELLNTLATTFALFSGKGDFLNSQYIEALMESIVQTEPYHPQI